MAASLTTRTGRPKAFRKSNRIQPRPRFAGSAAMRPSFTGPGKPMVTASNFQSATAFLIAATMRPGLRLGPDGILRGAFWPVTSSLTLFPPTSTTRIFKRRPPGTRQS